MTSCTVRVTCTVVVLQVLYIVTMNLNLEFNIHGSMHRSMIQ